MSRFGTRALVLLSVYLAGCGSETTSVSSTPQDVLAELPPAVPAFADDPAGIDSKVVYQATRVFDEHGNLVSTKGSGPLAPGVWQRVARPWTHLDDAYLYHEQAWQRALSGGRSLHGYRVVRTPNRASPRAPEAPAPPLLDPRLTAVSPGAAPMVVKLTLRNYPHWDVPLVPPPSLRAEDRLVGLTERAAALQARERMFKSRTGELRAYLEGVGAKLLGLGSGSGWLTVKVTPDALAALRARTDIARIDVVSGHADDAAQFSIGEARSGRFLDADRFLAAGDSGEVANPDRHAYGDVVIGVNEVWVFNDEACYAADGYGCLSQSRVREKLSCAGTTPGARCSPIADFPDVDSPASVTACTSDATCAALNPYWGCVGNGVCDCVCTENDPSWACVDGNCTCWQFLCGRHGTVMSSTILSDYRGGQGDEYCLGDPNCPLPHGWDFKNRATGIAPEASMIFWGNHPWIVDGGNDDSLANSFAGARERHVDIVSDSWIWRHPGLDCNPVPILGLEVEAENAFDDGILVVQAAGNTADVTGACAVGSPADLPKAFTVNGLATGQSTGCESDYNKCKVVTASGTASARGGADVKTPDGVTHPLALSLIALVAPTGLRSATWEPGEHGIVAVTLGSGGTSQATAVVSGTAAVAKSFFLAHQEDLWINSPGRFFTVMLAMTDRHFDTSSTQRTIGADIWYGLGRLKLRRFDGTDPAGQSAMLTETLDSTAAFDWAPFAPLAEKTELVKCVLSQDEDMSDKPYVSHVKLTVELRSPGCSEADALLSTRTDESFDVKKLVAFATAGQDSLPAGACVRVVVTPDQLADTLTMHVFCYASSMNDDAQLPDGDGDGLVDADEAAFGTDPAVADTDGDGVSDGVEVHERNTSPIEEDTDRDGIGDATDLVTFDHCTTRGLGAPSLTSPTSAPTTNPRPTLKWHLPANAEGALVELCADKNCLFPFETIDATGTSAQPSADLAVGTTYWRAFARVGGDVGCAPSAIRRINRVLQLPSSRK